MPPSPANVHQFRKELVAARTSGVKPGLVPLGDSRQQALFVAQRILELRDEGIDLDEIAVLYRAHYHSMEVQMELTRHGIPFRSPAVCASSSRRTSRTSPPSSSLPSIPAMKSRSSAWSGCSPASARDPPRGYGTSLPVPRRSCPRPPRRARRTLRRQWRGSASISRNCCGRSRFRRRAASRGNNSCTRSRKLRPAACRSRPRK